MEHSMMLGSMIAGDWPSVRRIFEEGIAFGHATFETEAPSWEDWDAGHLPHSRLVAKIGDEVVGWVALCPVSQRTCYEGVAEVSYYVAKSWRGQGIGRLMLKAVIESSERHGIWTLTANIFPENIGSQRMLETCGFRLVGRRERIGKMKSDWRDTLIFERRSDKVGID